MFSISSTFLQMILTSVILNLDEYRPKHGYKNDIFMIIFYFYTTLEYLQQNEMATIDWTYLGFIQHCYTAALKQQSL